VQRISTRSKESPKKALVERALGADVDHYLGGEAETGNSRKTVVTDTGKIEIGVPRDRQGSFDPQCQRHFPGFDDKIISMYARGMSTREITGHLHELYGIDVSPDLISTVTDAMLEVAAWQQRPSLQLIDSSSSMRSGSAPMAARKCSASGSSRTEKEWECRLVSGP
jgi:transposase-like protein